MPVSDQIVVTGARELRTQTLELAVDHLILGHGHALMSCSRPVTVLY